MCVQQSATAPLHAPHARQRLKEQIVHIALYERARMLWAQLVVVAEVGKHACLALNSIEVGGEAIAARE